MLYVQLDCNWPDNVKVIDAGLDGAGLHAVALCLAKRLEDDGWLHSRLLVNRYGATDELIDHLVSLTLFDRDGDRIRPHGWHRRNPSQAAIDATRASKREAGRRGNHTKWKHPGPFESCAKCHVIAGGDQTGSQDMSTAIGSDPTPTSESESEELEPAIADASPLVQRVNAFAARTQAH